MERIYCSPMKTCHEDTSELEWTRLVLGLSGNSVIDIQQTDTQYADVSIGRQPLRDVPYIVPLSK